MENKIVEICKKALLKQLHPMIYQANTYPVEAVSKATVLSLDKLVESEIAHLYSAGEEVYVECDYDDAEFIAVTHEDYIPLKKLTRPTVSEIKKAFDDAREGAHTEKGFIYDNFQDWLKDNPLPPTRPTVSEEEICDFCHKPHHVNGNKVICYYCSQSH